jgi:hypothetical protein
VLAPARTLSSSHRYSQDDYVSDDARWQLYSVNDIDMRAQHILTSAIDRAAGREKADYLVALVFVARDGWHRGAFEKALSDADAAVRCCAAWGLGEGAGNAESIPFLTTLRGHGNRPAPASFARSSRPDGSRGGAASYSYDLAEAVSRPLLHR